MTELSREYGRRPKQFDAGAAAGLRSCRWPGNVRELRNVVERLMIMVPGDTIHAVGPVIPRRGRDRRPRRAGAGRAAARSARSVRARVHPQGAGGAARQHLAHGRSARRRAQQPVPEDARVRHRAGAPRRRRGRAGIASGDPSASIQEFGWPNAGHLVATCDCRRFPRFCRTPKWDQLRAQILHCSCAIVGSSIPGSDQRRRMRMQRRLCVPGGPEKCLGPPFFVPTGSRVESAGPSSKRTREPRTATVNYYLTLHVTCFRESAPARSVRAGDSAPLRR